MYKKIKYFSLIFFFTSTILFGCGYNKEPISKEEFYFDTIISITLYDKQYEYAIDHCMEMANLYENLFSDTKENSDIYKINHANGKTNVNSDTIDIINKGISYSKLSDGQFDISIGKLCDEWDLWLNPSKEDERKNASLDDTIKAAKTIKENIDYSKIDVSGDFVSLNSDAAIDLGGIAKGYIADKMKEYLLSEGIESGFINLGGNVLTLGPKPDGTDYTVGIQKPFDENGTAAFSVQVSDKSVVTSGTYQRYYESVDGRFIHHIIDPKTGLPCDNNIDSVTIISKDSVDGDALSTICFLLGHDKGMALIESIDNTEAIYILSDGQILVSSGIGKEIKYNIVE